MIFWILKIILLKSVFLDSKCVKESHIGQMIMCLLVRVVLTSQDNFIE